MLARNETIFKWALYAGATAVFFLLQGAVLQRITLWGVIPFVFPILVAVLGMYEGPLPASVYALTVGVLCDLLLPASIPCFYTLTQYIPACFYTLIFPAAGLCAALISQSLLPAGFLCGVVTSVLSFLLTDAFHCVVLWAGGKAAWAAGAQVFLREVCVSILLVVPVVLLFSAVFRRTHLDD